jgi:hypothetical protein
LRSELEQPLSAFDQSLGDIDLPGKLDRLALSVFRFELAEHGEQSVSLYCV